MKLRGSIDGYCFTPQFKHGNRPRPNNIYMKSLNFTAGETFNPAWVH